jgi:hypothetical protein
VIVLRDLPTVNSEGRIRAMRQKPPSAAFAGPDVLRFAALSCA